MSIGPEVAEGESKIEGTCATCGRPLTQVGSKGECLRCLASVGLLAQGEEAEKPGPQHRLTPGPLKYDHFEVEVGPDGFPIELGAGAMAITYRARDTILNSIVALKVIDRKVGQSPGARSRFLREARAAAQIRHPNVARVSHYGEQDGECFYVMELVQGETLEERVRKNGPMPLALALEITEQVARALAAAEACGVVHRDIKPSNIMIESDASETLVVKVIDYGVAKVLTPQTLPGVDQTQGGFIGTPAFASPEQFGDGQSGVDTRSDIYSLGATLWYLLTGRVPFLAGSMEEIRKKQQQALPLEELRSLRVPSQVTSLLKSMLAGEPRNRPQSARELLHDVHRSSLRFSPEARARRRRMVVTRVVVTLTLTAIALVAWWRQNTRSRSEMQRSIAVMPFANLSSSAEDAYFAVGIQDEILTRLAGIADLKIISRTSTERYKNKPEDLKKVAQELGVGTVLEGSVQRVADKVRVNVQLIDARTDTHLWANTYDREIKDVLGVEAEISQEVANSLQAKLSPAEASSLTTAPTQDQEAYDFFLKGEYAEHEADVLLKAEPFDRAATFYEQALARDPNFALAGARLVVSRVRRHFFISKLSPPELDEVKRMAERVIVSAPNLPEPHIALGTYYYLGQRQYDDALKELERALELQPNNIEALELSAFLHRRQGRWKLGISEMEKCEARDPRNPQLVGNIAAAYCSLRMWKEAKRAGLRALAIDPHSLVGLQSTILALINGTGNISEAKQVLTNYPQQGTSAGFSVIASGPPRIYLKIIERDFAGALKLCETEVADPGEDRRRLAMRAAIYLLTGDTASARDEISHARELLESRLREHPDDAAALLQLSWVKLALGEKAAALRLAQRATETVPVEKDALIGPTNLAALAEIQARTDESAETVKTLQRLLAMPIGFYISIQQLNIDPVWDSIRNDAGFQQLLAGKEQIGSNK